MNDQGQDLGEPIYIDAVAMLRHRVKASAKAIALDIVMCIWAPSRAPFEYDTQAIVDRLNAALPGRKYTAATVRKHLKEIRTFFAILPDGRWAPSPKFFAVSDDTRGLPS